MKNKKLKDNKDFHVSSHFPFYSRYSSFINPYGSQPGGTCELQNQISRQKTLKNIETYKKKTFSKCLRFLYLAELFDVITTVEVLRSRSEKNCSCANFSLISVLRLFWTCLMNEPSRASSVHLFCLKKLLSGLV